MITIQTDSCENSTWSADINGCPREIGTMRERIKILGENTKCPYCGSHFIVEDERGIYCFLCVRTMVARQYVSPRDDLQQQIVPANRMEIRHCRYCGEEFEVPKDSNQYNCPAHKWAHKKGGLKCQK